MKKHQILQLADARYHLVSRDAALRAGASPSTWRRAITDGLMEQVHPGVGRVAGAPDTPALRIAAAVLAVGGSAIASHRSAAFLWESVDDAGDEVHVIRRRSTSSNLSLPGVVVHRPRDRKDLEYMVRHGIALTSAVRTLCDLGAVAPDLVGPALTKMRIAGHVSYQDVRMTLIRHARSGRNGISALREALEEQALDAKPADSVLEEAMARVIAKHGLPAVEFHARIAGFEVDFWITGTPLYIECDGWSTHGLDKDQFEFDRRRDAALVAAGMVPIRFTWKQITLRPAEVAGRITAALRQWAPHLVPPGPRSA